MPESNGLPLDLRDAWSALALAFNDEIHLHGDNTSMNALFPVADYDSADASLVLREEDPDIEFRLDQMFAPGTKS